MMSFEWNERKRRSKLEKHGLDFLDVSAVFEAPHIEVPSAYSGDEESFLAIGTLEGRCVTVVYTTIPPEARLSESYLFGGRDMKKDKNIKSYTAAKIKAKRVESRTDLSKVDAMTDEKLERLIAEDEDERDIRPDWTRAKLVFPKAKQSVHLRLEQGIIDYFKSHGKGHISRMQAVLKAYVEAHRPRPSE